jgi:hypothetical protein
MRRLALLGLVLNLGAFACGGDSPSTPATDAGADVTPPTPLANLVAIDEIAAYQTVKISVVQGGAVVGKYGAPIVTAKPGVFRVFYKLDPKKKFRQRTVEAELHLIAGTEKVLKETKTIVTSSTEESFPSTFNFPFDEKTLGTATQYYVVLRDPALVDSGAEVSDVRFPTEGTQPLTVSSNPGGLNVVIVPIQYAFDGSNRLPETGQSQLDAMKSYLLDMYPVEKVSITVRSTPLVWSDEVKANGNGWGELLGAIVDLRAQDAAPRSTYYVGAFQPKGTLSDYCGFGCVLGLAANVTGPFDIAERAVISIGYPGGQYDETVAHELGHVHGRYHSPCGGAQGTDPKYPYDGGSSGVAGYRISQASFLPSDTYDMMGYCQPEWISDYTYKALFDRVSVVNGASMTGVLPTARWERLLIAEDGTIGARSSVVREEPGGEVRDVVVTLESGAKKTLRGHWVALDHVKSGFLWVESAKIPSTGKMTRVAL